MTIPRQLLLLAALVLCAGCASTGKEKENFHRLQVTNHRGAVLSEWVAQGNLHRTEQGYRIIAVERLSGGPHPIFSRYPDGWRTTVTGPHILHWPCGKPFWLYELEND